MVTIKAIFMLNQECFWFLVTLRFTLSTRSSQSSLLFQHSAHKISQPFYKNQGNRESLNENQMPEQLFDNPNTDEKEVEGISAVKAISLASQQGQTVYTISKDNYNEVLPQLNHGDDVMMDIRNAINVGKEVTVHQSTINFKGWNGSGYIIIDPKTGVGGYMIGAMISEIPVYVWIFALSAILFVVSLIVVNPILGIMFLVGTILAFGCALSNYYDSNLPADLSGAFAGLFVGAYGLIAELGLLMYISGSVISFTTILTSFS